MKHPAGEDGFTLLEMLVALVVFGLLMAGLTQTIQFGLSTWSAGQRMSTGPQAFVAAAGAMQRLIGQAAAVGFVGRPNGLAFTTRLPAGSGLADPLADVALVAAPGQLVLRWVPHPPGIPLGPLPAPRTEVLLNGVAGIDVRYLTPQPKASPIWTADWHQDGAPLLVRIKIRFMDNADWPDLVVAPVAGNG